MTLLLFFASFNLAIFAKFAKIKFKIALCIFFYIVSSSVSRGIISLCGKKRFKDFTSELVENKLPQRHRPSRVAKTFK